MKNLIKRNIKKIINFYGWKLIKIYKNKDYTNSKPNLQLLSALHESNGIFHMGAHRGSEAPVYDWLHKKTLWIEANPKISTSIIAFVFFEIFFLTSSAEMQKFDLSISAKTGMQFQCKIAVAVAHIVHGETIISSPGSTSKLPIIAIKPEVQEFTEIAYLVL